MFSRISARVVTGPVAFLLAGLVDVAAFAAGLARERVRVRVRRLTGADRR